MEGGTNNPKETSFAQSTAQEQQELQPHELLDEVPVLVTLPLTQSSRADATHPRKTRLPT